jgi:hypothetical protein
MKCIKCKINGDEVRYRYKLIEEDSEFARFNTIGYVFSREEADRWRDMGFSQGKNRAWHEKRIMSEVDKELEDRINSLKMEYIGKCCDIRYKLKYLYDRYNTYVMEFDQESSDIIKEIYDMFCLNCHDHIKVKNDTLP